MCGIEGIYSRKERDRRERTVVAILSTSFLEKLKPNSLDPIMFSIIICQTITDTKNFIGIFEQFRLYPSS